MPRKALILVSILVSLFPWVVAAGGSLASDSCADTPSIYSLSSAPRAADDPTHPISPVKLVFLHHSVGDAWLEAGDGGLGDRLGADNYYVSDTFYEWGPDEIGSFTDIGDWWTWFRGPDSAAYMQAVYTTNNRHANYGRPMSDPGGENEIILFKSCYPNSHLGGSPSDPPTTGTNPLWGEDYSSANHTVANAKGIYNDILQYFATRQDKLFVVITAPPLVANDTDAAHAANIRALNDWLVNSWLAGYSHRNVAVFDFYNVLTSNGGDVHTNDLYAESGNHHRWRNAAVEHVHPVNYHYAAYPSDGDSHPNPAGNRKATSEFLPLLNIYYNRWKGAPVEPTPDWSGRVLLPLILKGARPVTVPTLTMTPSPTLTPPPTTSAGCPSYAPGQRLITDRAVYAMPVFVEPAPRQWLTDPTFGTCVVRVTDRAHDLDPGDISPGMVNEYARVQSFNANSTRLLAYGTDGTWYLYNAETLTPVKQLPLSDEPRWDAQNPDLVYHVADTRLLSYNVETGEETELRDFVYEFPGQNIAAVWTRHEGSPSHDTRYWGLMVENEEWLPVAFLVYDRQTDGVTKRDMRSVPAMADDVDHVTMSPFGTYYLASLDRSCERGTLGTDGNPCGLMVYNRDLTGGRGLVRAIGHYDTAVDADGREVVIYQDDDIDQISMLDLASGAATQLWAIDYSPEPSLGLHFSGVSTARRGWAVISTHSKDASVHTWMEDQVFLVELKAGGRVVRLAHTHSVTDETQPSEYFYWSEPHASAGRDLTRILFATNWGRYDSGAVEMYMISLPDDWLDRLS